MTGIVSVMVNTSDQIRMMTGVRILKNYSHLLMELSQLPIFLRYRHTLQILVVPDGLEIAAYQKKVNVVVAFLL